MRGCQELQDAASGGHPLARGSRGDGVRILQRALRMRGFALTNSFPGGQPDGDYQGEVVRAVRTYQQRNGFVVDGMAGTQVLTALDRFVVSRERGSAARRPRIPLTRAQRNMVASDRPSLVQSPPPPRDPRVQADAGDRRLQRRERREHLPPEAVPVPLNPVVAQVYAQATELLESLIRDTQRTLTEIGCGRNSDRNRFERSLRRTLEAIAASDDQRGRLDALTARDAPNKRRDMIREVVRSLGGNERQANEVAERELTGYRGRRTPGMQLSGAPTNREVVGSLHLSGCRLYRRLVELRREVRVRYRGTDNNPQPGIDQTFGLLAKFPDVAASVYAAAELPNLRGVPPQISGNTNLRSERLVQAGARWDGRRRQQQTMRTAGLVVLGLVIGAVSLGTLSAVSATLVTAGFGVAVGAANIIERSGDYREAQAGYAIGATSAQTLELSADRLRGAYGALVIDVATAGLMSRVGGAGNLSTLARTLRVQSVAASGAVLASAVNPDTWRSPNTVALLLFGAALEVAGNAGARSIASRFAARGPQATNVQIAMGSADGPARVGSRVRVAASEGEAPIEGVISRLDASSNTVAVDFPDGSTARVRVRKVERIEQGDAPAIEPPARVPASIAAATVPRAERSPSGGYIYYRAMGVGEARMLQSGRSVGTNPGAPNPDGGKVVATRLESAEEFLKVLQHREGDYEYVIAVIETRVELDFSARHLGPGYGPKYHGTSFMPDDTITPGQVVEWRNVSMRGGVMRYTDTQPGPGR
ncbi:MAG: peptidoglycan-binding protein [Nannocystaceae bacterium]|nr:peptidoglycan-binding protein [bacterium]